MCFRPDADITVFATLWFGHCQISPVLFTCRHGNVNNMMVGTVVQHVFSLRCRHDNVICIVSGTWPQFLSSSRCRHDNVNNIIVVTLSHYLFPFRCIHANASIFCWDVIIQWFSQAGYRHDHISNTMIGTLPHYVHPVAYMVMLATLSLRHCGIICLIQIWTWYCQQQCVWDIIKSHCFIHMQTWSLFAT